MAIEWITFDGTAISESNADEWVTLTGAAITEEAAAEEETSEHHIHLPLMGVG